MHDFNGKIAVIATFQHKKTIFSQHAITHSQQADFALTSLFFQPLPLSQQHRQTHPEAQGEQTQPRVSSFTDLARVVQADHAAAVLPEMAKPCHWHKTLLRPTNN